MKKKKTANKKAAKKKTTKKKTAKKKTTKKKVAKKKKVTKKKVAKKVTKKKATKKKAAAKKKTTTKKKVAIGDTQVTKKKRKPKNYLNNKDLLAEVHKSKQQEKMTDKLAHMLQTLAARYARKGNFSNYTYNDDMQAYAMMMLVKTWKSFNPDKSKNPFAFYTQCIRNSFIQYLNQEKRHRDIRDAQLVENGLTPSFTYQLEHEQKMKEHREVDSHDQHIDDDDDRGHISHGKDSDSEEY